MKYYSNFRADFSVRLVVNSTQFHCGTLAVGWKPYPSLRPAVEDPQQVLQRHGCLVYAGKPQSYEVTIPFIYPRPMVSLSGIDTATPFQDLGKLQAVVYSPLRHSSLATATSITISVYVGARGVSLLGPTPDVYAYTGPRFRTAVAKAGSKRLEGNGDGPVSSVTSKLADAAGALSGVPLIGGVADMARLGFNALGNVASIFGFSRPNLVVPPAWVKQVAGSSLAQTNVADAPQALTLTDDFGVSADPRTVGAPLLDEMSFPYLCGRYGHLANFELATTDAAGTLLIKRSVTPMVVDLTAAALAAGTSFVPSPVAYVSSAHQAWSGSLIYKFVVAATPFHSGRIQVRYVPAPGTTRAPYDVPVAETCVIDLSSSRETEMVVRWGQGRLVQTVGAYIGYDETYNGDNSNGLLLVEVVNPLQSPKGADSVHINVLVRAGEDFRLFKPNLELDASYDYTGPFQESEVRLEPCQLNSPTISVEDTTLAHFGEIVPSARALCKRYSLGWLPHVNRAGWAGGSTRTVYRTVPNRPPTKEVGDKFFTTWPGYFGRMFLARRGGVRVKMATDVPDQSDGTSTTTPHSTFTSAVMDSTASDGIYQNGVIGPLPESMVGELGSAVAVVYGDTSKGLLLEAELPSYTVDLFLPAYTAVSVPGNVDFGPGMRLCFLASADGSSTTRDVVLFAAAEDFSMHWFQCSPVVTLIVV